MTTHQDTVYAAGFETAGGIAGDVGFLSFDPSEGTETSIRRNVSRVCNNFAEKIKKDSAGGAG